MKIMSIFKGVPIAPLPLLSDLFSQLFESNPSGNELAQVWLKKDENFLWTSKSSISLALIAQLRLEVANKSQIRILVPEYFCDESLNQLRKISFELIFYPMDFFQPGGGAFNQVCDLSKPDIVIFPHYFGEPLNLNDVACYCKKANAWLIEDAAHCFERSTGIGEPGFGDFILFSQHKHLPLPDGALLILSANGVSGIGANEAAFSRIINIFNDLPKLNPQQKLYVLYWTLKRVLQIFGIPLSVGDLKKNVVKYNSHRHHQYPGMSCLSRKLLIKIIPKLGEFKYKKLQLLDEWNEIIKCFGGEPLFNSSQILFTPYMAVFNFNGPNSAREICGLLKLKNFPVLTWPDLPREISNINAKQKIATLYYETRLFFPLPPSLKKSRLIAYRKFAVEYISKDWGLRKISFDEWTTAAKKAVDMNFLQSWRYGEAKRTISKWLPERYVIEDKGGNALFIVQASVLNLVFGYKVAHINRGPILLSGEFQESELMRRVACIRLLLVSSSFNKWLLLNLIPEMQGLESAKMLASLGFIRISQNYWGSSRLCLSFSEEEILAGFSSKWRGSLRKSINSSAQIRRSELSGRDINTLLLLYEGLKETNKFRGIKAELIESLVDENFFLYMAYMDNEILGALVTIKSGYTCTYFIGATNKLGREFQANSQLLWKAILDAKSNGCLFFDVGGLDKKTPKGISSFKKGLNGVPYTLIGVWIRFCIFNSKKISKYV